MIVVCLNAERQLVKGKPRVEMWSFPAKDVLGEKIPLRYSRTLILVYARAKYGVLMTCSNTRAQLAAL